MSILLFLLVLFALILVHELGHFVVAKWTGMRVDEFGIGFPPKLFGVRKGETEYTLNALPIGGFVKIFGEDGVTETGETSASSSRAFGRKPRLAQAAVLVAGVAMNVVFAWMLFVSVLLIGVPTPVTTEDAGPDAVLTVAEVVSGSPAETANIPRGAVILRLITEGEVVHVADPESFASFIATHVEVPIVIEYQYRQTVQRADVQPIRGLITADSQQPAIGVSLALIEDVSYPLDEAIVRASQTTVSTLSAIFVGLTTLLSDALTLSADLSEVAGPVGIVSMVGEAADFGITSLLLFTAVISLNLAVINLLPFPALDGGRLLFVAIESVIRRPINPIWASRLNLIGFVLLIMLMVAVTFNDIVRLW